MSEHITAFPVLVRDDLNSDHARELNVLAPAKTLHRRHASESEIESMATAEWRFRCKSAMSLSKFWLGLAKTNLDLLMCEQGS